MKCKKCKHPLSKEEINANLCWECGTIIDIELVSDDMEEAQKIVESVAQEQKKQNKQARIERNQEVDSGSEYSVISTIHTYFSFISILAVVGGIVLGIAAESFLIALMFVLSISIVYCFFRVLIAIAYLLCDIKENTSPKKKSK